MTKLSGILTFILFLNLLSVSASENEQFVVPSLSDPEAFAKALDEASPFGNPNDFFSFEGGSRNYHHNAFVRSNVVTIDTRDRVECVKVVREIARSGFLKESEKSI